MRELFKRGLATIHQPFLCAVFVFTVGDRINRGFLRLMPEPPAPAIRGLMQSDAVDPRLKTGLAVEMLHSPENFQKYFLGSVSGVGWIINDAVDEPVNRLMKFSNEPRVSFFLACLQLRTHCGF